MFTGSMVALVTPMTISGDIDYAAVERLIDKHIQEGTTGIVVAGTTGEAATLNFDEQLSLMQFVVEKVAGRIVVIAGTAANATQHVIERSLAALQKNVDACLIMTPAYIKPSQEGLYLHYKTIANAVTMPIIVYNVPSRTACDMTTETVAKLANINNIIGIKEATGNMVRAQEILNACGEKLIVLSGDDATALPLMMLGGKGVISVTANVAPKMMREMCQAVLKGDYKTAINFNSRLLPLHNQLFVQANPIPTKWVLSEMGLIENILRLPLTPLAAQHHETVREAMKFSGII